MSTGPEHYQRAEELLARSVDLQTAADLRPLLAARAQVHATLALAAATALVNSTVWTNSSSVNAGREIKRWGEVAATQDGAS